MDHLIDQDQDQEQTIHLTEYYHLLLKHKWLILAALFIISTLTVYYTFSMVPVYRATCIMVIDQEKTTSPLTGERLEYDGLLNQTLVTGTHIRLITSRPVIWQVIKKNKLDQPKKEKEIALSPAIAFFSDIKKKIRGYVSGLKENIRILLGRPKPDPTPLEKQHALIAGLRGSIRIEPVEDTKLLHINVINYDPQLAANVANSVARSYIEFNLNNRASSSRNTLTWMTNQLYEIQKKLEDAEEEFLAFKQKEKLVTLEGKQAGFTGKIADLNDIYIQNRNQRMEAITKLKELERNNGSWTDAQHVRNLLDNPLINDLYSRLLDLDTELTRLSKVYKHKHPKMIQAKTALDSTHQKLRTEIKKEINNIKAELTMFTQKEEALKQNIESFEADALTANHKELKYTILDRNVTTQQRLYDILLQRVEEADITGDIDVSNIRIAETAVPPPAPFKPNKPRQMMLGIMFGLMVGVGLAFLREYLDRTLRTEEDIQRHLDLPVLGIIPEAEAGKYKRQNIAGVAEPAAEILNANYRPRSARTRSLQGVFLDRHAPNSGFAETYRTLRTNIHFCRMDRRVKSLVLTSAVRAEGKSVTSANMAFAGAQAGMSVLMIDADLRKPTLSSLIPSSKSPGLTGLLSDVFGTEVRSGALAGYQLGDLFRLLGMQKKTGMLHLTRENEEVELLFYQGKLVDLNWLTRPEDERLASVLVAGQVITKEQVKQAFAQQKATGQKLGFILLHNGLIKREALKGPLTLHMMEGLRKALSFSTGSFAFKERSDSDFEPDTFDPVDFDQIYKQLIIGEEPIAYLREMINQAVLKTHVKNLFLLPAGSIPPNPSELLSSDRMSFLLSNLQKRFDLIIIDTPPVVPASDALLIAPHADGVLLVVKAGEVNREMVIKTVQTMRTLQTNIVGVVLNQVDIKRPGYYKYYFKNYSQYYTEKNA